MVFNERAVYVCLVSEVSVETMKPLLCVCGSPLGVLTSGGQTLYIGPAKFFRGARFVCVSCGREQRWSPAQPKPPEETPEPA